MTPLAACPTTPAAHLRLAMLGALAQVVERADDADALVAQHTFVGDYLTEMRAIAGQGLASAEAWRKAVGDWAAPHPRLPLSRLYEAGCGSLALNILSTLALAEEEPRLALLFDGGVEGPLSLAMLTVLWQDEETPDIGDAVAELTELGLVSDTAAGRRTSRVNLANGVWDALNGPTRRLPCGEMLPPERLPDPSRFVPPRIETPTVAGLADMLRARPRAALRIIGPRHNGRHNLASAVAGALGRPLMVLPAPVLDDPVAWRTLTAIAWMQEALVLVRLDVDPGAERSIPSPAVPGTPLLLITGEGGGLALADDQAAMATVALPLPDAVARDQLWRRLAPELDPGTAASLGREFRITSGAIARAARDAGARAFLTGRDAVLAADVRAVLSEGQDSRLSTVAQRIPAAAAEFLALDEETAHDFAALALRCRHREALATPGYSGGVGVRALFVGPSGAGKTLAARRLAADLGKPLFRIDLAATVSKYIGETEKNLERAFAAAEDRDCILLLDEGDALMTRRTDVGNANDRYANLETNFLLQRIEAFEGILLVTSNAGDRIDKAFARRMDVVIHFRAPDEVARYQILERELGAHRASDALVQEVACRCVLSGGQLRNVAQHARLLAIDHGGPVGEPELIAAVRREYRKAGGHCPLKLQLAAAV